MGTPKAAVTSLERLIGDGHEIAAVYTQPDRPSGRGNKITMSALKQYAIGHSLTVLQPEKIRTPEALEIFRSHEADAAVVVAYGRILPETFLTAFPHGAINVHFSLLPKYRGAAPVNWAIVDGETETGVTTMQMDAGLDTGPIMLQRSTPISAYENSIELMERLLFIGAELLSETLANFDSIGLTEQDHDAATSAPILRRADGLIDWTMSGHQIANRIRGFQPFPSSFTTFSGGKFTIWKAEPNLASGPHFSGEVIEAASGRLVVSCGGGTALKVDEVQPEGKRRMSVRDFLNGVKIVPGERLGE